MKRIMTIMLVCMLQTATSVYAQDVSNYIITTAIGNFAASSDPIAGKGPGILAGANHFYQDHSDMTYEVHYFNHQTRVGPKVQVTQHADSDSDKWLLHEVESSYKTDDPARLGLLSPGAIIKRLVVGGDRIFSIRYGGGTYMWVSNNVVVSIDYIDMQGGKPEPREVMLAYLQKFPSTIPSTLVLDQAHDVQWIKDEMERRLWLCDKWFNAVQTEQAQIKDMVYAVVKNMENFLDYRERYFKKFILSKNKADDKRLLHSLQSQQNATAIKERLQEYKKWWNVHKADSIFLPLRPENITISD